MKRFLSILTDYILLTLGTLIMAAALVFSLSLIPLHPVERLAIVIRKLPVFL